MEGETRELQTIISKETKKLPDGCVLMTPMGANTMLTTIQNKFQENGMIKQQVSYLQKDLQESQKKIQDLEQKYFELQRENVKLDKQAKDYNNLVINMMQAVKDAETRKRLAKIFRKTAKNNNLTIDIGALLDTLLD